MSSQQSRKQCISGENRLFALVVSFILLFAFVSGVGRASKVDNTGLGKGDVYRTDAGNWHIQTARYTAVVDGMTARLISLEVDGNELLARGHPKHAGGTMYDGESFWEPAFVYPKGARQLYAANGNFLISWYFYPDAVLVEYAVNKAEDPAFVVSLSDSVRGIGQPEAVKPRYPGKAKHWKKGEKGALLQSPAEADVSIQGADLKVLDSWHGHKGPAVRLGLPEKQRMWAEFQIGPALSKDHPKAEIDVNGPPGLVFNSQKRPVKLTSYISSSGHSGQKAEVALVIRDPLTRDPLFHKTKEVRLNTDKRVETTWKPDWEKKGVYDASFRVRMDNRLIGEKTFRFVYDLIAWDPDTYCPPDFWDFWERQLSNMRDRPLDAEKTLMSDKSTEEYKVYEVEITGCDGRRITAKYGVPEGEGPFPVMRSAPHRGKHLGVDTGTSVITLRSNSPDDARYRKNVHDPLKSNFRYVYLDYIRWFDFLESEGNADFSRCVTPAGSRGGPMVIAAAALDDRISLITMNVGTCNRWDWQVKYLGGWGPYMTDRAPGQSEEAFIRALSYFDPTHFAPRVDIPVAASWGMLDGLSPLPGQMSCWTSLNGPRYLELRPQGGHNAASDHFDKMMRKLRFRVLEGKTLPKTPDKAGVEWKELFDKK